ncbi:MAG: hypothetical protein WEA09_15810 [Gemmatimonadota bacterium]
MVVMLLAIPGVGVAQEETDRIPGVTLGLTYESRSAPALAIQPFRAAAGSERSAGLAEAIVGRDLRYSNRFEVLNALPESMTGEGVDYAFWDQLGTVWLVTGAVEPRGEGYVLSLELHDVVYRGVRERAQLALPADDHPDFRMAVHGASDRVVEWATGEPGMAASRILFSRVLDDGNQELFMVDSDGENFRRVTNYGSITLSPSWHPAGDRILYTSYKAEYPRVYELNLRTGQERMVPANRPGDYITPTYHPNGQTVAFAIVGGDQAGLFTFDLDRNCCLTSLTGGRWEDLSPTYSPDGRLMAFNSNRLGVTTPQIYLMPGTGGEADLISPYVYGRGGYYTSPVWSPRSNRVAFHGRVRAGRYQILVADIEDQGRRVTQLTAEGNNEDPSWAPDGRHLVFAGERSYGFGLFVVDSATGRIRTLVSGVRGRIPAWSPSLAPQGVEALRGDDF